MTLQEYTLWMVGELVWPATVVMSILAVGAGIVGITREYWRGRSNLHR